MSILTFYKNVLEAAGAVVDSKDRVQVSFGSENTIPFLVGEKQLVLPTQKHMTSDQSDVVLFHPCKENALAGESKVLARLREAFNTNLNMKIEILLRTLLDIGTEQRTPEKLRPHHIEALKVFKDADKHSIDFFERLTKAMNKDESKSFVHIYLKPRAVLNGKNYRKAAVVYFPIYEELEKHTDEKTFLGVKFRKKDIALFKAMMEMLFPDIAKTNHYSRGDLSEVAPSLDALLRGVLAVAEPINEICEIFSSLNEEFKDLEIASDWVDDLDNMRQFASEIRMIPMQAGNEGVSEIQYQTQQPQQAPVQPQVQLPQHAQQQSGIDFQNYRRAKYGQAAPMIQQPMPPQQPGYWSAGAAPMQQQPMTINDQIRATGRPAWEVVPNNFTSNPQMNGVVTTTRVF
jgi:hypothetical protein